MSNNTVYIYFKSKYLEKLNINDTIMHWISFSYFDFYDYGGLDRATLSGYKGPRTTFRRHIPVDYLLLQAKQIEYHT